MQLIVDRYNRRMMVNNLLFTDISQYAIDVILLFQLNKQRILYKNFYDMYVNMKMKLYPLKTVFYTKYMKETSNGSHVIIRLVNKEIIDYGLIIVLSCGFLELRQVTSDFFYKPILIYQSPWITIKKNKNGISFKWASNQVNAIGKFMFFYLAVKAWHVYFDPDNGTIHKMYDIEEIKKIVNENLEFKKELGNLMLRFNKIINYLIEQGKI